MEKEDLIIGQVGHRAQHVNITDHGVLIIGDTYVAPHGAPEADKGLYMAVFFLFRLTGTERNR
jgi:hypothetical protein